MSYSKHTSWSEPSPHTNALTNLPIEPVHLADMLENFLIHHMAARFLNFGVPEYAEGDRNLRTTRRLLDMAFKRDSRPLSEHRDLPAYLYGSCHDFALIAVSRLRSADIEARLRVGFVDYFKAGFWEDHWLCEYKFRGEWRLLDAQLGKRAREGHGIKFDVGNVPRKHFRTGSEMWTELQAGKVDPQKCGLSGANIKGYWFPSTNVFKDAASLAGTETLPWDYWGIASEIAKTQEVPLELSTKINMLANAFLTPPETPEAAKKLLAEYPWADTTEVVLSSVQGKLVECSIL